MDYIKIGKKKENKISGNYMFGGLEGTQEELMFIDDKMYPRRKIETIKRLMEELDEDDLREYLIQDILKPRKQRKTRATQKHSVSREPLQQLEEMFAELEPVNKIVDFKSPAQKEIAVSEAIKVAKKRGRPKIYHTEEDRKKAKTGKTIASNIRKELERKVQREEEKGSTRRLIDEETASLRGIEELLKKSKKQRRPRIVKEPENYDSTNDIDADDFPINQILEPVGKKGSGLKHILKTKLGESVRGSVVAEYMKKHNVSLGIASKMVKQLGLY
jgi:hypothetical protein